MSGDDWKVRFKEHLRAKLECQPEVTLNMSIEGRKTHTWEITRMIRECLVEWFMPPGATMSTTDRGTVTEFTFLDEKRYRITVEAIDG